MDKNSCSWPSLHRWMAVRLPGFLVRPGASALKLYPETSRFFSIMSKAVYGVKRVNTFPLDIGLQTGK